MNFDQNVQYLSGAFWQIIVVAGPILGVALAVGLLIGLVQAATSINEMTLSFVPKLFIVLLTMSLMATFTITQMTDYFGLFLMKSRGRVSSLLPIINELGALPGLELQELFTFFILLLLASLRVGSFLVSAPFFGGRMVPLQIRIVFSFCLGFWILDVVKFPELGVLFSASLIPLVLQEIFIGLTVGLTLNICFAAASLAGEKIAATSGLAFASQVDPTGGGQSPVISQILILFLILTFFAINGHLIILSLLYKSFEFYPVGQFTAYGNLVGAGIAASDILFKSAAVIVLPIVVVLLFVNISIGFITKSAPQLNLFSFGFPMTLIGAFFILFYSVDAIAFALKDLIQNIIDLIIPLLVDQRDG